MSGPADSVLRARLESELPALLAVGRANSLLVHGYAWHPQARIASVTLLADGREGRTIAHSMPRPDVYAQAGPGEDPRAHSYRSGFWGIVDFPRRRAPDEVELTLRAKLRRRGSVEAPLGSIRLTPGVHGTAHLRAQWEARVPGPRPAVAIVMPTFDPDPVLFERQIASIRDQTHSAWLCLICDDHSSPERFAAIERIVGDDERFILHRAGENVGFYRNYERALAMVPSAAEFVAPADQDDHWHPHKLAALLGALEPGKQLAYSDMRVVRRNGDVFEPLYGSYWQAVGRPNEYRRLGSVLIANTVTGAASLFRRSILSYALPMPHSPGPSLHDHWLAIVAMRLGGLTYVDRPLQDYVLHERNATSGIDISWREPEEFRRRWGLPWPDGRRERLRQAMARWRAAYTGEVLHLTLLSRVALTRTRGIGPAHARRALAGAHGMEPGARARGWLLRRLATPAARRRSAMGLERTIAAGLAWRRIRALESRLRRRPPPPGLEAGPLTAPPGPAGAEGNGTIATRAGAGGRR